MLEFMKYEIVSMKQKKAWEKTRRMGKWRFVLIHGVLLWGITTAIIVIAMDAFFRWNGGGPISDWSGRLHRVIDLIVFPLFGIIYGLWIWHFQERAYQKTIQNHLCANCGYDLRGTHAAGRTQCPECGCDSDTREQK